MTKVYGPTLAATKRPVRTSIFFNEKKIWVGIGSDITIERKAPKEDEIVKEATPEQYKLMYEKGICKIYIEETEVKKEVTKK